MIAGDKSVEEIRQIIGADSLTFLSVEGMLKALGREQSGGMKGSCLACFTGKYPTERETFAVGTTRGFDF